jgi:nicotinamidase-related amidase
MLLDAARSVLLIVDVQEKLLPAMAEPDAVVANGKILMEAAARLGVPVVVSEQYPKGLGPTVPALAALAAPESIMAKLHFSCAEDPAIGARLASLGRSQIVIAGIESHVCVLQTALGLGGKGVTSIVAADATSSRAPANKAAAMARFAANKIETVTTEMVVFEWLGRAGTPEFKDLSRLVR